MLNAGDNSYCIQVKVREKLVVWGFWNLKDPLLNILKPQINLLVKCQAQQAGGTTKVPEKRSDFKEEIFKKLFFPIVGCCQLPVN